MLRVRHIERSRFGGAIRRVRRIAVKQLETAPDGAACDGDGQNADDDLSEKPVGHRLRLYDRNRIGGAPGGLGNDGLHRLLLCGAGRLHAAQQRHQEGNGGEAVELDALLFQRPNRCLDLLPPVVELRRDRPGGDVQQRRDLLDAELVVVSHTENQVLFLRQSRKNLLHQAGGLLPIQRQLRLIVNARIRQLRDEVVLVAQLREGQRQTLVHLRCNDVHGDPPQPREEGVVVLQRVETAKGPQIGVLLNVPRQLLVADHGADTAVQIGAGQRIKLREGGAVSGLGLRHQLRRNLHGCGLCLGLLFHFIDLLLSVFSASYVRLYLNSRASSIVFSLQMLRSARVAAHSVPHGQERLSLPRRMHPPADRSGPFRLQRVPRRMGGDLQESAPASP